jgi:hypothetical protein
VETPARLDVRIFPHANGEFVLYEDDGVSGAYLEGASSQIRFAQEWSEAHQSFHIEPAQGDSRHLPPLRSFDLHFYGLRQPDQIKVTVNGAVAKANAAWDESAGVVTVSSLRLSPTDRLDVELTMDEGSLLDARDRRAEKVRRMLRTFRLESEYKNRIDQAIPQLLVNANGLGRAVNYLKDSHVAALEHALEK